MIPIYKIKGVLETFYVFGKEKLLEHFMDDGVPAQLWDDKLEDLNRLMIIITKTLEIEQMNYKIGELVSDNAGHVLRVVTINAKGVYITVEDGSWSVKYYQERELSSVKKVKTTAEQAAILGIKPIGSVDRFKGSNDNMVVNDLMEFEDILEEKSEHQRQVDFFFKRGNK